jgi:hypothetical protein
VASAHWSTALVIILHCVREVWDENARRALGWLLTARGAEGRAWNRFRHWLAPHLVEQDQSIQGWPYAPETSSWVEPTALGILALRKAARYEASPALWNRLREAEKVILDRRCPDGGWNFGNRRVLGEDMVAYPETTGIALLALQGHPPESLAASYALASRFETQSIPDLGSAWLTLAVRAHGLELAAPPTAPDAAETRDVMLTALRALGATPEAWRVFDVPRIPPGGRQAS